MLKLDQLYEGILKPWWLKITVVGSCLLIAFLAISAGLLPALGFALLPFLFVFLLVCIKHPYINFLFLFTTCFFIMGIIRYVQLPFPSGIVVDAVILFNFAVITINQAYQNYHPHFKLPLFFLITVGWTVYCLVSVFNPAGTLENWMVTIRGIALYICLFQFLSYYIFKSVDRVKQFFIFWATLCLLAALKAIGQKFIGFDTNETIWLYTSGRHTHVIYSGIRYFSFFTDAANFGCHMGLATVVFSILAIHEKFRSLKIYYILVAALTMYGMFISGTRSAMAIPFVGFAFYIISLRRWQFILAGAVAFLAIFGFLAFTTIGNSNADIRRMRTAFQFSKDASYNVRLENQEKMREFMGDYPIGLGIGAAKHTEEGDLLYELPTDTSFVFIWVETGIVGLVLYLLLWFSCLVISLYYLWMRLKDPMTRMLCSAASAGIAGMMAAGYGNEVLHQFPTGQTVYILMAIVMLCPYLENSKNNEHSIR
ncbi:O-antigen ligase family protein [Sphingobacterium sp. DN00404]|uniref:O-antigen ligase family protein n=1 Tax=Sphingobacterium micropteri TaxID=2763501 RepID=A0ABR7YN70_9SPHI|nr:O-antigen ligase family protein [Sphingobacterium micropteri]MBD1432788.1 O-antigen ligase family protein [Sphingobacterium micropteri]